MTNANGNSHPLENLSESTSTASRFQSVRIKALEELDNKEFTRFHAKVCFVAGVGFFTDTYDLFAISIAAVMLGYVYGPGSSPSNPGVLSNNQMLGVKVAAQAGALVGQLMLGSFADVVGRRRMYGFELVLIIFATFAQAIAGGGPGINVIGSIIFWRFLMGIAIGGDYPLSAVIASEFASVGSRGRLMTAVFAFQGWGQLAASIVSVVVTAAYKDSLQNADFKAIDQAWRILLGVGCVPGVIALYFRFTIPESPRFTLDIQRSIEQASRDIENALAIAEIDPSISEFPEPRSKPVEASWVDFTAYFGQWKNMKVLIGCSYSWFAFDIAFYGLTLNNPIILDAIHFQVGTPGIGIYQNLKNNSVGNVILTVAGLIPGFWVSFLVIDKWGRRPIQLMGFTALTVLFISMGSAYTTLKNGNASEQRSFVFLYCVANFFQNFGPNTTTFIIPAEVFPTRYRSTAHGIAAASGKLGAVIAEVVFAQLVHSGNDASVGHVLQIYSFFMFTGIFSTLLLPETKCKSLEELATERDKLQ